jgi:hypothetical protein
MIPRTVYLGEEVTATAAFLKEDGSPYEPSNSSLYPIYTVLDPQRRLVTGGIGTLNDADGLYEALFTMPISAELSQEKETYSIEWVLEDTFRQKHYYREGFDVAHPSFNITGTKEHQKITLPFTSLSLSMPFPVQPRNVECILYSGASSPSGDAVEVWRGVPVDTGVYSEYSIYSTTIPANTLVGGTEYLSCWNFETGGTQNTFTQPVYCATLDDMQTASYMRMYLDKVMKDVDLYQGYRDSDLVFHYRQAPQLINTIGIYTQWTLTTWNTDFAQNKWLLMEAAKYSALRAQFLAEGDSAFDFSHQSVTLSVDRTQYIEAELGRIWDYLQATIPVFKKAQIYTRSNVGHLGLSIPTVGQAWGRINRTFEGIPLPRPVITMK